MADRPVFRVLDSFHETLTPKLIWNYFYDCHSKTPSRHISVNAEESHIIMAFVEDRSFMTV
jgi:hypothetical protein